jgi:uncharacterized protein with PQ loop repeat
MIAFVVIAVSLLLLYGYLANIFKFCMECCKPLHDRRIIRTSIRVVGMVVPPLGVLMGLFFK